MSSKSDVNQLKIKLNQIKLKGLKVKKRSQTQMNLNSVN